MATNHTGDSIAEEDRIRNVYARRRTSEKPGRYSLLDPVNLLRVQQIERTLARELSKGGNAPIADCRILDVGCGEGFWLRELARWGARPEHLFGVDLLPERIASARRLSPEQITFEEGSAADLRFPGSTFDLVTQFTMFTSILNAPLRQRIAAEMTRVLKPNGRIIWFDFHYDNPRNRNVRGIKRREIQQLFPRSAIRFVPVGLAPPIANLLGRATILHELLCEVPLLCTHHIASIRPPSLPAAPV